MDQPFQDEDPLSLDPETMRRIGYQTVDMLVDWVTSVADAPVIRRATPAEMEGRLSGYLPEGPQSFDRLLEQLGKDVLPFTGRVDHPAYFAFIPGSGTWPAALGDFIASACNIFNGSWMESAGPSRLELIVLDWFKEWIGYPVEASGILVSGGSSANMTALACARETLLGAMSDRVVVYVSDQAHSSMARAGRVLGFRPDQMRVLPTDERYRMRPDALRAAMDADIDAARQPFFAAASAGSTNTGAIDPLEELADLCREYGIWFHIDAAYGGFAALTERGKRLLAGLELADSVTLDPHKWLYQPFECGCLLVRDGLRLRASFEIEPDYLKDVRVAEQEVNFADLGLQLSRMSRALKVWLSLQYFGADVFRAAIDRSLDLARLAQKRIEASGELELLHPATLGIVCFRRRFDGVEDEDEIARLNSVLVEQLTESGQGFISSTRLRGHYALRLCILNHTTGTRDVERVLRWLEEAQVPDVMSPAMATYDRDPEVTQSWLAQEPVRPGDLQTVGAFRGLSDADLQRVVQAGREEEAPAGRTIVRRWEATSDFYVILAGTAEVRVDEQRRAFLGPGDFFGELAALDWGAQFGYPRLASVTALSPMRLLVIPSIRFRSLMRDIPSFHDVIQRAVRRRLPGL